MKYALRNEELSILSDGVGTNNKACHQFLPVTTENILTMGHSAIRVMTAVHTRQSHYHTHKKNLSQITIINITFLILHLSIKKQPIAQMHSRYCHMMDRFLLYLGNNAIAPQLLQTLGSSYSSFQHGQNRGDLPLPSWTTGNLS